MSVEEIDRRLENRFALLRGGDRSAPDRHQTLLAVIDWSWNILDEAERRALRRLALFNDGFALEAADAVLGGGALDAVGGLVDQSLLSVRETPAGVRYRMLETVREFGRMQLVDAGEDADARAARRRWATAYAERHGARLVGREQFAADRRRRRGGDQPRRRAARRDRRRRPRRARAAARRGGAPVDGARRARPRARARRVHRRHRRRLARRRRSSSTPPASRWRSRSPTSMMTVDERGGRIRELLVAAGPGRRRPAHRGPGADAARLRPADPAAFARAARATGRAIPTPTSHARGPVAQPRARERRRSGRSDRGGRSRARAGRLPRTARGRRRSSTPRSPSWRCSSAIAGAPAEHAGSALPVHASACARRTTRCSCARCSCCAPSPTGAWPTPRPSSSGSTGSTTARSSAGSPSGGSAAPSSRSPAATSVAGLRLLPRQRRARCAICASRGSPATGLEPWVLFGESTALAAHAYYARPAPTRRTPRGAVRRPAASARCGCSARDDPRLDYPRRRARAVRASAPGACCARRRRPATRSQLLVLAERLRLQPHDPHDGVGADRAARRGARPRPDRGAARAGHGDRRPRELLDEARELVERLA